jgi:beta-lactamase class A
MPVGTTFTVDELLQRMIAHSDNTATNVLVERMGFDALNEAFQRMGLERTRLVRKMMDFASRRNGVENVTTAEDVARLFRMFYHRRQVGPELSERCLEFLSRQEIRDRIPAGLPPSVRVAHKTGLERGVCHDAGIVFTPKGDLLICVLTRHHQRTSSPAKRFIAQVAQRAYRYATSP